MPTPFSRDQLSAPMRQRYGLERRPIGRWIAAAALVVAFAGVLAFVALNVRSQTVDARLLDWHVAGPDRVDLRLDVRRSTDAAATCVLRAQDRDRIDVAYATLTVPAGDRDVTVVYSLRTLAPAVVVEVLGCSTDGTPRVVGPQFPVGIAPPPQPY